jgi:hypothetical protein
MHVKRFKGFNKNTQKGGGGQKVNISAALVPGRLISSLPGTKAF